MKILFLPNWQVIKSDTDIDHLQSPDKFIQGIPYWFFKYFPKDTCVDVIDFQAQNIFHRIEKKIKFYIRQAMLAIKIASKYDIVLSHGAQSGLVYALLSRFLKKEHKPLHVIIDIGAMNGGRNNKIETFLIRVALKSHPAIIYHASVQENFYQTVFKGLIRQSRFIPFGVNTAEFYPLNLSTEGYVLSFGYAKRDYTTLLNAWQEIKTTTRLYIVGDDTIVSRDNIISFPKVSVDVLKQYIARCLFVVIPLPVYNYAYGQMSFLQAMAMGKPVIVTRTPSSVDYLQNAQGAFLVDPFDKSAMKHQIEYLLSIKDELSDLGYRARTHIINGHFDEKTMAENIYNFIKTLK